MSAAIIFFIVSCILQLVCPVEHQSVLENRLLGLYEGDIMIRNGSSLLKMGRNAITNREGRWPEGVVVYAFDPLYDDEDRQTLLSAMEEFHKHTCIRWVERTDEEIYVEIENDMGCWSELGRIGGVQSLSLEKSICLKKGVIIHEMMHTLGFQHEQSRPDRDEYVTVIWDNIISGMEPNFIKLIPMDSDDQGIEYDYKSIMHYSAYMFAKDRSQPTLKPTNSHIHMNDLGSGQVEGIFTDLDIQRINKFYECP